MSEDLFVLCPHCSQAIEIIELNCCIFRCGIYKNNMQQIDPHTPKKICDALFINDQIYGCGKPFQIVTDASFSRVAVVCEYI